MPAMIDAVELFLGLRYLRAKRRTRFVSFISGISLVGIALGVAALIVILSAMNGFEGELRDRLVSMSAHGRISDAAPGDWESLRGQIIAEPGVAAAAPYIEGEGMIRADGALKPVLVSGVVPAFEDDVSGATIFFVEGSLDDLVPGGNGIVLGRLLALDLGVRIGDGVVLLIPRPDGAGGLEPILQRFVLRGVFEAGLQDHDSMLALVHADDAVRLMSREISAVRFRAEDVMAAPAIARSLQARLGSGVVTTDWTQENASYFRAIRLEKMMMSLILSLIIGVAAFNIVASLVMVVTDKTSDIAILRTLGMGPNGVVRVFFIQGALIGWLGVVLGVLFGLVLAFYLPAYWPRLEQLFGFQLMPGDVYYVTEIPSDIESFDVVATALGALIVTSLATLYPARRAAKVDPSLALRYE